MIISALKKLRHKAMTMLRGGSSIPAAIASDTGCTAEPPETLAFRAASTVRALERIASRSLEIGTVIDIGASNGMWTEATMPIFPNARYLLIEAHRGHEAALKKFVGQHPAAEYVLSAAGDEEGEAYFDDHNLFGGLASRAKTPQTNISVPMITVDAEVERRKLNGPFLVKLDTHGFEVPILEGARETLRSANLVVLETYNFRIAPNSLLFYEMCRFMENLGFGVIDISEPMWRTYDQSFWQFDLFFIPLSRPEFNRTTYA